MDIIDGLIIGGFMFGVCPLLYFTLGILYYKVIKRDKRKISDILDEL